ncbi:MAG: hypothetical protein ACYDEN_11340 [Acidimicrobiales bacterium]
MAEPTPERQAELDRMRDAHYAMTHAHQALRATEAARKRAQAAGIDVGHLDTAAHHLQTFLDALTPTVLP